MKGRGVIAGALLVIGTTPFPLPAQQLVWHDSVPVCSLAPLPGHTAPLLLGRITQSVRYTFTFSGALFFNWERDPSANNLLLIQELNYECIVTLGSHFSLTKTLLHQLGVLTFPDSLTQVQTDINTLDIRLAWRMGRNHGIFLSAISGSRLLNGYSWSADSLGQPVKLLTTGFLTPFTVLFTGGIQFIWPTLGSLQVGLSGTKLTWIRDKRIYETLGVTECHGVAIGENYLLEYGFTLQFHASRNVAKWMSWDCDMLLLSVVNNPVEVNIRNLFTIHMTRWLKTTIQTRIFYEERVSKKVQIENVVSLGVALQL